MKEPMTFLCQHKCPDYWAGDAYRNENNSRTCCRKNSLHNIVCKMCTFQALDLLGFIDFYLFVFTVEFGMFV